MFPLAENGRGLGVNPEEHFIDEPDRVYAHPMSRIHGLAPHGWIKSKNG